MIIYFSDEDFNLFIGFCHSLLNKRNSNTGKGTYFKKSSSIPSNYLYLKSYLENNKAFQDFTKWKEQYFFILSMFNKLTINQFYCIVRYCKDNRIYALSSNTIYEHLDECYKLKSDLQEKDDIVHLNNFLKIIY